MLGLPSPALYAGAGLLAGAVMTVLAWVSKTYAGVEIPAEVALQYMVPNAEIEVLPPPETKPNA